ncbi:MAG TPA: DUF4832 domain-containing protein [Verrucomicrobiota bacterium]|nr:DUF4832 domain-containing protein [Verrucomicrobiota bacterium]
MSCRHTVRNLCWLPLLWLGVRLCAGPTNCVVEPRDTGAALVNPGMGWTFHFFSNLLENYGSKLAPSDTLDDWPGLSVVYLRVPWGFLEPEEGKFNWSLLDTPAQRWIAKGKRIALRITTSENWMRYATPAWVKAAGAKGVAYQFGQGPKADGAQWDPDFLDPIYLQKLEHFLAALAQRYDGNPNVAFIDIGTFGLWGEAHTLMSSQLSDAQTLAAVKRHIDLHVKYFRHTLLCLSDDAAGHDRPGRDFPIMDYARVRGVTLRDDSILVQPPPRSWYHAEMAAAFWPTLPVILEHEHYGSSKLRNAWGDGSLLLKAVEDYHASYLSIHWWPREELNENRELIQRINRRLGYRLQLREISWPAEVALGTPFTVTTKWANAGVAPCYGGGFWALTLKDDNGGMVSVHVAGDFDVRQLEPGPPGRIPVTDHAAEYVIGREYVDPFGKFAPATQPGTYTVFVSVGQRDGTPTLALPLPADDGQHRYRMGRMTVTERR